MGYDCLTLLTDYGTSGGFVGVLHAVAFQIAPRVPVIDLDHAIPPQDVRLGALRLERLLPYLPEGVHVAVVDPGVGGARRGIALAAGASAFVGPDNGILVWAARQCGPIETVVSLENEAYWLASRSRTFDGRDIFVPVAAHLATGVDLGSLGPPVTAESLVELERPVAWRLPDGSVELEVLQVDSFGNVQLSGDNLLAQDLGLNPGTSLAIRAASNDAPRQHAVFAETFGDVAAGGLVVLIDSDGLLAVSVNGGDAARTLGALTAARAAQARDRLILIPNQGHPS